MINHIMCTSKILTDLCFTKQRIKTKNAFVRVVYSALVVKMCRQSIKIELKNYFKQIPVPFKIYADFECNLRDVESYEGCYTKKYQDHIPCSFAYKIVCVDDRFTKPIVVYRGKNAAYEFINLILKEYKYCKKVMNKNFNNNLIMSEKEEHLFQQCNSFWICKKRIDNDEEKVRDHFHVTGKFRGAAHWSCNINLQ